tara:strand:- start:660 stop:1088 length:429 start_codon:yes stop_codon:yes gene_type:complete
LKNLKSKLKILIIKKNFQIFLLIFALIVILLKNTDFFKNSYYIVNKNYDLRLQQNAYDFCENSGTGFIFKIKNKYKLTKIPQIKNYNTSPKQDWIFQNYGELNYKNLIVLFNLDQNGYSKIDLNKYKIIENYKNDCLFLEKK